MGGLERVGITMPTLNIVTNASVDRVAQSDLVKHASEKMASLIGKPESFVMVGVTRREIRSDEIRAIPRDRC